MADIYQFQPGRMADFIDRSPNGPPYAYALKANLTLNADMTLTTTPANVEAMGKNYFDKAARQPGGLGPKGNADYVNYYAASLIGYIALVERSHNPPYQGAAPPQMTFDMARLHLSEKLLEEKGINLGQGNTGQQRYYDSSTQPPAARLFQHTINTHQHVSPVLQPSVGAQPGGNVPAPPPGPAPPSGPREPALTFPQSHPDYRLYDAIRSQLPRGSSEELSAHVLVKARENGIRDVHQLDKVAVVDGNAWVVGRTPGFWAKVDLAAPVPPLQESLGVIDAAAQQDTRQVAQRQQTEQVNPVRQMGSHSLG